MITSNTYNNWNSGALYATLIKLLLVFLLATAVVASCDDDYNDYDDHNSTAGHAERTLR